MNLTRREPAHVAGVLVAAILVRVILFKQAGVWGDWGFYVYNAELLNEGQMPFVDFIARSPLLMQTYAVVASLGNQAYLFRVYVLFWWLLAAVPLYGIAREIKGHRAGIATLLVYLLTPFGVTYMMWGNTQSLAAFLLVVGLYLLVRKQSVTRYGIFGCLIAMAFLTRRSVVVVLGAIGLYQGWQYLNDDVSLRGGVWRVSAMGSVFLLTLFVGYLWLAQFDLARAGAFYDIHAVNLFFSSGRGGFPLLGTPPNPAIEDATTDGIPIIHDLCQRCGAWTAKTFAKTLVLITPVTGILLYYCRDWVDRWFTTRDIQYVGGILGALALYALVVAIQHGYYVRSLSVIAMGLFAVVVHQTEQAPRELLYGKKMMLLFCVLLAFTAGYLYRARLLHTYYFMDFWPAIAVLAGVLYDHAVTHSGKTIRAVLAVAIVLSLINTSAAAYPITNIVINDNSGEWFTIDSVQEYGDDMDARTQPGDEVLAANPSYVALSHADMVRDNSRLYYTLVSYKDSGPGRDIYEHIIPRMQNGTIQYVIYTGMVEDMLSWNSSAVAAFESNYCPVETDGLYQKTNATLYRYTNESC